MIGIHGVRRKVGGRNHARRWWSLGVVVLFSVTFTCVFFSPDGKAAIADRKREPVVVKATPPDFAQWLNNGTAASSLELWAYKGGAWTPIPYQVDEVSLEAQDVKSFIDPTQFPGAQCQGGASGTPPNTRGPCEFLYDLRGTSAPSGSFTTNDELVFIAGTGGDCGVSTSSWPDTGLDTYRYRIQIADNAPSSESGCVYLFRRLSGSHPSVPNLVDYDPVGDGAPATCKPTSTACGTITGQGFDVDGDGTQDDPPYRMDFRGNWTGDRLMIGQTALDPSRDMVDLFKYRIDNPGENEQLWDMQVTGPTCASFVGTIDGPVRVVRVIQGAASGLTTRKLEFAYPGEVRARIYYRVHQVGGPIYNYIDINEATASPPSSRAKVFKQGFTTETAPFDTVDGVEPNPKTFEPDGWYQVSSDIGSFVEFPGQQKNIPAIVLSGAYDDTTIPLWKGTPGLPQDWDDEDGDRAAARTLQNGSNGNPIPDTENPDCKDPWTDSITPIREGVLFALSSGRAASDAGSQEVQRRNRGVFSQCIVEEQQGGGGGGGTCVSTLTPYYDHDGGNVRMGITQCDNRRWNVYQALGGGTTRRLGTLAAGQVFVDNSLALNEERTYKASTLSAGCGESALSAPVTVLHDDVVAPPAPQNFTASATPGHVTASWTAPIVGDIAGFKLLSASQSGGPYTPVHSGLLSISTTSLTFPAVGGATYYVVGRTVDIAGNQSVYTQEIAVTVP